ncbi:hypothetical protein LA080_011753 [Diaporthe eres]|nr:hypothetical protein LA080_011753 [Diaporthe eres]
MERESPASQLPWNSAVSVEYVNDASGAGYYPNSALSASTGSDDVLGFDNLWGSRAPEFDVVLGVLVGQKSVEVQLGYWDGVMDSSAMRNLANMYQRVVSRWLEGNGEGLMCEIRAVV